MAKVGDHVDTIYGIGTVITGKRVMLHQQNEKIISYEGDKDRDKKKRVIRGVLRTRLQVEEMSTNVFKKFMKDSEKMEKELEKERTKEEKEKLKIEKERIKELKLANKEAKEKLKSTKPSSKKPSKKIPKEIQDLISSPLRKTRREPNVHYEG